MTPNEFDGITCIVLAFFFVMLALTGCPDHECPVFPTAAPRQ
ncbi:MAG TPA: hypothetical protein VH092_23715 [Urbifossiella sp.]|jgi:hypothetical protein|nr:hypothetical protein [Urbifossiella sp.]